jgi:hypothetical protein
MEYGRAADRELAIAFHANDGRIGGKTGERMPCPDGSCTFWGKTYTAMQVHFNVEVHFMHQHWKVISKGNPTTSNAQSAA